MPIVHVDTRQFSGVDPGLEPDEGSVWFWPYRPYVDDSVLVSKQIVKVKTVDGLADPFLPETPIGQGVWVQLRAIKGAGEPWIVIIPSGDVNLFDLDHIDPDTLDPEAPLDPAWVAAAAALAADIVTAQESADAAQADATAAIGSAAVAQSDANAAQSTADTAVTSAGAASAAATAAQADADAAQDTADNALAGLADKANTADLATVATSGQYTDMIGTVPTSALPDLAVTDVTVVASQAAMLALTAQKGDVAVRTDTSKTYILATNSPTTLADWKEITAAGAVTSVAGRTGTVSLAKADVGLTNVDNTSDATKPVSSAQATADAAATTAAQATSAQRASNLSDLSNTAIARDTLTVADYAKLLPWFAALTGNKNARADVGILGASVVEGYPVTSFSNTIGQLLAAKLRRDFPVTGATGGRGLIGIQTATIPVWPLAFTGGLLTDQYHHGAKHRAWYATGNSQKVVLTLDTAITSFNIHHVLSSSGGATAGYYKIDGGAAVTFNTFAATDTNSVLTVASAATTSIEVGRTTGAAGFLSLSAIRENNGDETKGTQVHNLGHGGFTAAQWDAGGATSMTQKEIAALGLDLLIMQDFGINDGNTANGNRTAAQFKTDLLTFIADLRTAGVSCPILMASIYNMDAGYTEREAWAGYVTAMQEISTADSTIAFVNHSARMPATGAASTYGLYNADLLHSNANGAAHLLIAETLYQAIKPR